MPRDRRQTSDVTSWAENLPEEFLACRDLGHSWRSWRAWKDTKARTIFQVLRCERCQTERERELSLRGERLSQSYRYPDTEGSESYLAPKGSGAFTVDGRAELRLLAVTRLLAAEPNQAPPADLEKARAKRARTKPATTKATKTTRTRRAAG